MMMDAIVQLVRNALCCVKDLNLLSDTFLYQANHTNAILTGYSGIELPEPLNKTTPLEFIISITQLYACFSCTYNGVKLIWNSVGKLRRIVHLVESRLNEKTETTTAAEQSINSIVANKIVNESMMQQAKAAFREIFIGFLVAPIGVAFFWLFANSWHITETPWIGGLVGLIDALTVMELCLLPLLVFMVMDGVQFLTKCQQTKNWIKVVDDKTLTSPTLLNVTNFEFMEPGWVPFWESGTSPLSNLSTTTQQIKQIEQELKLVKMSLDEWFPRSEGENDKIKDGNEKEEKIRTQSLQSAVQNMKESLHGLKIKGYREILYFFLNFVAFYGYLMGIVAFYYPEDDAQPSFVQTLKLGYGNAVADWTGNFAGDMMWTVEPIIILGSSFYLTNVQTSNKAKANDEKVKKE
jgi:hypothetical protein